MKLSGRGEWRDDGAEGAGRQAVLSGEPGRAGPCGTPAASSGGGGRLRRGAVIEPSGGTGDGVLDVVVVGEGLAREGFLPEQAPPALLEVQPAGADRQR